MNLDTLKYPDSEPTGDSSSFSNPEETIKSIEYGNKLQKINTFLGKINNVKGYIKF